MVCNEGLIPATAIPATGHTENIDVAVEATCIQIGLTDGLHCSVCNEILVAQSIIPAMGHREDIPVVLIEPTETATGVQVVQCVNCREILRTESIPAMGKARLPGDANNDGTVDIRDALHILQYCTGHDVTINTSNSNVNADGSVDAYDALLILQYEAGWNVSLQ